MAKSKKKVDPLTEIKQMMVKYGFSVSQAIRYYSNLYGLPKGF